MKISKRVSRDQIEFIISQYKNKGFQVETTTIVNGDKHLVLSKGDISIKITMTKNGWFKIT